MDNTKMTGADRRAYIMKVLEDTTKPITGATLALKTGVSRQVIVTDIALLRTGEQPIIATNRGYLLKRHASIDNVVERVIVCKHGPQQTEAELEAIVDCGVTVVDVIVEHPLYGDLTGSLMIDSRYDVASFIEAYKKEEATLMSILTDGVHLHTLRSDQKAKLDAACEQLRMLGILVE